MQGKWGKPQPSAFFSEQFDHYLYLNLEIKSERDIFEKDYSIEELLQAIFFYKNQQTPTGSVLIFIDEIQNCASAVSYLRYFYEVFSRSACYRSRISIRNTD